MSPNQDRVQAVQAGLVIADSLREFPLTKPACTACTTPLRDAPTSGETDSHVSHRSPDKPGIFRHGGGNTPAAEQLTLLADEPDATGRQAMSEAALLAAVRSQATRRGWMYFHCIDARLHTPGWPDVTLAHTRQRRILFLELKRDGEQPTPAQQGWLDALAAAGCETGVLRPADLPDLPTILRGDRRLTPNPRRTP